MVSRKICLITTAHLSENPRLIKEANALHAAGHHVTVIACHYRPELHESDQSVLKGAAWSIRRVCWDPVENPALFKWSRFRRFTCHMVVTMIAKLGFSSAPEWLEIRAFDRVLPEIRRVALEVEADLFVGHNPGTMPIVWKLARDAGAKCGFDAEDFHSGMNRSGEKPSMQVEIVRRWEKRYLSRYDYLTAASPLIAREYCREYPISFDAVVLNAFDPVSTPAGATARRERILALYWVSQTIGAHRGLEDVIAALAHLRGAPIRVFLRGEWQAGYEARLRDLAESFGVSDDTIVALPSVAYDEYVVSATRYDVGLATEEPTSRNRQICLTNKILMYLSAGLAVAATNTPAQTSLIGSIPQAGFVFPWGDPRALAEKLSAWLDDPELIGAAKRAALDAARDHYNWNIERSKLERVVGNMFMQEASAAASLHGVPVPR